MNKELLTGAANEARNLMYIGLFSIVTYPFKFNDTIMVRTAKATMTSMTAKLTK